MIIWAGRIKDSGTFIRVHNGVVTAGAPPLLLGLMTPVIFVVCVIVLVGLLFKRKPNNEGTPMNCGFCIDCKRCKFCLDCKTCEGCENCEGCLRCVGCKDCLSCWDCDNCVNCINCTDCSGLSGETGLTGVHR